MRLHSSGSPDRRNAGKCRSQMGQAGDCPGLPLLLTLAPQTHFPIAHLLVVSSNYVPMHSADDIII